MAQDEQFNENSPASIRQGVIKKYDVNGDGVFDANEVNCIMDDFLFLKQTNTSLVGTNSNQKKLLSGAFLLIVLLAMSNLGTALLAVNMSKEVVVVDGKIMANGGSQEEAISTMNSVRTVTQEVKSRGSNGIGNRRTLQDNEEANDDEDWDTFFFDVSDVCFTQEQVESFYQYAKKDSGGTTIELYDGSESQFFQIKGRASKKSKKYKYKQFPGKARYLETYTFGDSNVKFVHDDRTIETINRCVGHPKFQLRQIAEDGYVPVSEPPLFFMKSCCISD